MHSLRWSGWSLLIAVSLVGVVGFGCGGDGGGAAEGTEGGKCFRNDTCDTGLTCSLPSKICVRPSSGTAGTGGGGTTGAAGAGGSAGTAGVAGTAGGAGATGAAGSAGAAGAGGSAGATGGTAGTGAAGAAGTAGQGGTAGAAGAAGRGGTGGSAGSGGGAGTTAGAGGAAGAAGTGGGSAARYTLSIDLMVVVVSPTGGGSPKPGPVTSVPAGITCGGSFASGSNDGDCEENYTNGTSVVLTAQGTSVVNFTAWTGDCTGTNPVITVVMDRARNCRATFTQIN
jgi:uncharacterized repeat protein (TIGR02543 family)